MTLSEIQPPTTTVELRSGLLALHDASTDLWNTLPTDEFFSPQGNKWSPAEHVRHLNQSNGPVAAGLGTPKAALLLRFGPAFRSSRPYAEVVRVYRAALDGGLKAMGPYVPQVDPGDDPEATRDALMGKRERIAKRLDERLGRWGETALDRLAVRHPALGKMTVREILCFTLYHNHHHLSSVLERRV